MASIAIDLDEEELQVIAATLVENYIETNFRCNQNVNCLKFVKKSVANIGQFMGIMFSLVGANILTKMYENTVQMPIITNGKNLNTIITDEIDNVCNHIYGCDGGRCWRTCDEKSELSKTICFTNPIFKQKCSSAEDCEQCGECTTVCESRL